MLGSVKLYWNAATRLTSVLSVATFAPQWEGWIAATETASGFLIISHSFLVCHKISDAGDVEAFGVLCLSVQQHFIIFSVTRSYPLCQNKKTAVWMMCLEGTLECGLSYQMIRQNSVSSNDTVTAKKQYMLT